GQLDDQQADHAAAKDDNRRARSDFRKVDTVDAAGERFAEGAMQRRQCQGQLESLLLRDADIFRKATVAMDAGRLQVMAEIDAAALAFWTLPACDIRIAGDAHAFAKAAHAIAHSFDDAAE